MAGDKLAAIGACVGDGAPTVRDFLTRQLGIDDNRLAFHIGWFQDTVPADAAEIGPVAILRLDGDWYESIRVCLHGLYDLLVPGGYLIIDDYGDFPGCRKAVDEFFAARGESPRLSHSDHCCVYMRKG